LQPTICDDAIACGIIMSRNNVAVVVFQAPYDISSASPTHQLASHPTLLRLVHHLVLTSPFERKQAHPWTSTMHVSRLSLYHAFNREHDAKVFARVTLASNKDCFLLLLLRPVTDECQGRKSEL